MQFFEIFLHFQRLFHLLSLCIVVHRVFPSVVPGGGANLYTYCNILKLFTDVVHKGQRVYRIENTPAHLRFKHFVVLFTDSLRKRNKNYYSCSFTNHLAQRVE